MAMLCVHADELCKERPENTVAWINTIYGEQCAEFGVPIDEDSFLSRLKGRPVIGRSGISLGP